MFRKYTTIFYEKVRPSGNYNTTKQWINYESKESTISQDMVFLKYFEDLHLLAKANSVELENTISLSS